MQNTTLSVLRVKTNSPIVLLSKFLNIKENDIKKLQNFGMSIKDIFDLKGKTLEEYQNFLVDTYSTSNYISKSEKVVTIENRYHEHRTPEQTKVNFNSNSENLHQNIREHTQNTTTYEETNTKTQKHTRPYKGIVFNKNDP